MLPSAKVRLLHFLLCCT